ncbi:CCA tRNA nucleotidyltransferase [Sphingosinicella sp. YJ22]|uniref:CCA tRNA nucleotidyltransferase n=1 Tax=Sphingosinicella sp. YJ22 TaxID=1104780 RepID=UPI00140E5711|nr:CCA tRNA nucleotidyltransferase [Sphingosinicella sp. YJ22]
MKLPDAPWQGGEDMRRLLATLGAAEGDTRFVGGCVRDTLLGITVADVDLATRLLPEEVIRRLEQAGIKAVPTGLAHGTVTAVIRGKSVEITTLRRDVSTDGRRATVAFTDDWREDAGRRDFTINALSADPESGEIFDYFGGLEDLAARQVRFIGDALTRIAEDHLRILRFFRFHARFGAGAPDPAGLEACTARANDLMALSRERIAGELLRLLALPDPTPTVRIMVERGIFSPVLPEIDLGGVERLAALPPREQAAGVGADGIRRLAALLPRAEIAVDVAARLRLSNAQRARLECIERAEPDNGIAPRQLAYRIGAECAADRLLLDDRFGAEDAAARIGALASWRRPSLPVRGGDLVAAGVTAGPEVARLLRRIEDRWIGEDFPGEARARAIMAEELRHGA